MRKTLLLTALALTTGIALGSLAARLNAQPAAGALAAFQRVQADAIERLKNIKISGDPDRDFASLLISNHEEGLFLARSELEFGGDQQLREAAQKISETRQKQVDELKEWLARHSEVANNRKRHLSLLAVVVVVVVFDFPFGFLFVCVCFSKGLNYFCFYAT